MAKRPKKLTEEQRKKALDSLHRDVALRQKGYRERALRLFPHICASCCREFDGKRLQELTVHHKDHNHNNNPPDGSNWELLCIYCHDHEHEKLVGESYHVTDSSLADTSKTGLANPFDGLDSLLEEEQS